MYILKSIKTRKKIGKFDKNNKLIKEYKSLKDAAEDNNIAPANISVAYNHKQRKQIRNGKEIIYTVNICGNYLWKYL
jgi:hypothetical protein